MKQTLLPPLLPLQRRTRYGVMNQLSIIVQINADRACRLAKALSVVVAGKLSPMMKMRNLSTSNPRSPLPRKPKKL